MSSPSVAGEVPSKAEFFSSLVSSILEAKAGNPKWARVPTSLAVAQSILESGWGTSKAAVRRNNLFGIMSFKNGVPTPARFRDAEDSVVAYFEALFGHPAHADFRNAVNSGVSDPKKLAATLTEYSETPGYSALVVSVIRSSCLKVLDALESPGEVPETAFPVCGNDGYSGIDRSSGMPKDSVRSDILTERSSFPKNLRTPAGS